MMIVQKLPGKTPRSNKGVSTVIGTIFFLILVITIISVLFVSLYRYNDNVIQAISTEEIRAQEKIALTKLTLSNGYITSLNVENLGSITIQIRAIYVNSKYICDPSDESLNINGAYIGPQESSSINLLPVLFDPASSITVATSKGMKAIELQSNLIDSSNTTSMPRDTYYGPLQLNFSRFYCQNTTSTGVPITDWSDGSQITPPLSTQALAWNITVKNIDVRNITLNKYSALTLVSNTAGGQRAFYIKTDTLFIQVNQTVSINYVWDNPQSEAALNLAGFSASTAKVFLTFYGTFSDGTTYGQTMPFKAVHIVS